MFIALNLNRFFVCLLFVDKLNSSLEDNQGLTSSRRRCPNTLCCWRFIGGEYRHETVTIGILNVLLPGWRLLDRGAHGAGLVPRGPNIGRVGLRLRGDLETPLSGLHMSGGRSVAMLAKWPSRWDHIRRSSAVCEMSGNRFSL